MKLHDLDLSGNAYKVRLFLSLIGREATLRPVDFLNREHKTQAFLRMNPRGQIPVLEDGELQLGDSHAILVYLARRHADPVWYPLDPVSQGRIAYWLSYSANEVQNGPASARLIARARPAAGSRADPPARPGSAAPGRAAPGRASLAGPRRTAEHRRRGLYPYLALAPRAAWRWTTTRR